MAYSYSEAKKLVLREVMMQIDGAKDADNIEVLGIPLLLAGVGVGKTSLVHEVADMVGLDVIGINSGENGDPTDISGMPAPNRIRDTDDDCYMEWVLNQSMHEACVRGVCLFFDDVDKMPGLVEGALIGLFGKRMSRHRKLHPDTVVIAAGNRVGDDMLARDLSESIRTRATAITMEPTLQDFTDYTLANPKKIHAVIPGFLAYKPEFLHQRREDVLRFPTPRCWAEASRQMFGVGATDDLLGNGKKNAWKVIVDLKCGEHVGNDFWAWYNVVSRVNVKKLLMEGVLEHNLSGTDTNMLEYAAVFAVTQELNTKGVKPTYTGLEQYAKTMRPEMQVAMVSQLNVAARGALATHHAGAADILMQHLVPIGPSGATL